MDRARLTLAFIIPALDEETALRRQLPSALAIADEVVVSDGGSRDGSVGAAKELGARLVTGPAGRGPQLNRGAAMTRSDVILFLHADTRLPAGAAEAIREAIAGGAVGGAFHVRFDDERAVMRLGSHLVNLRSRLLKVPLGDQGQFVRRDVFESLGGFREWPILEDLDFVLRLRRRGRLAILPLPVRTSSRRFRQRGIARTVATNWLIFLLFLFRVSPARLARLYRHIR